MWRWSKGFITYNLRDPEKKREERKREIEWERESEGRCSRLKYKSVFFTAEHFSVS